MSTATRSLPWMLTTRSRWPEWPRRNCIRPISTWFDLRQACHDAATSLQHAWNSEALDLAKHGADILVTSAEMALRIAQGNRMDAGQAVILVVNEATAADQRPQRQSEHALVVPVFRGGPTGRAKIVPHQLDDIDAAVGSAGPGAADHQFVVHDMVANDMERVVAVDPFADQIGFRRREPGVAIAHQEAPHRLVVHHQKALKQADAGIFVA